MAAHVHTHDGLNHMPRAVAGLGSAVRESAVLASIGAGLKKVGHTIYAAMVAHRQARAFEEIARYDWRLAAEVRAAAMREQQHDA